MKITPVFGLWLVMFLAGCLPNVLNFTPTEAKIKDTTPPPGDHLSIVDQQTPTPAISTPPGDIQPTATNILSAQSSKVAPTYSPSSPPTSTPNITHNTLSGKTVLWCEGINTVLDPYHYRQESPSGTIVLAGEKISLFGQPITSKSQSTLLFWNMQSGNTTDYALPVSLTGIGTPDSDGFYFETSSNSQLLAFTEAKLGSAETLATIIDSTGVIRNSLALPGDNTLFGWLNEQHLLVRRYRLDDGTADLLLIDVGNGSSEAVHPEFSGLAITSGVGVTTGWGIKTLFSPDMTKVVFATENSSILWDILNDREILRFPLVTELSWSPDSTFLVGSMPLGNENRYGVREELIRIDPDNGVSQLTYLTDIIQNTQISLPVWSPDGKYLAFWTERWNETSLLAILTVSTGDLDLFCMQSSPAIVNRRDLENEYLGYQFQQHNGAPIIWSPDSQYILVEAHNIVNNWDRYTLLMDISYRTITLIATGARPVSWLNP